MHSNPLAATKQLRPAAIRVCPRAGTYLGNEDDATDEAVASAVLMSIDK